MVVVGVQGAAPLSVVLYWGGNLLEEGSATKSFSSTNLGVEPRIFSSFLTGN